MKKEIFSLVLMLVVLVGAYSGGQAEAGPGGANDDAEEVTIRFMMRETPSTTEGVTEIGDIWVRAIEEFESRNPNITIINESVQDDTTYTNKLKSDIAAGEPPHIFNFPGIASIVDWAEAGLLLDYTPYLDSNDGWREGFVGGAVEMFELSKYGVDGIYSVPYALNPEPFFYNKALFAEAGITEEPQTWPELLSVIDQLRAAGIIPIGIGNQNTWRAGHIHTGILYKYAGVGSAVELGLRERSYTDPEIVETFRILNELEERDAFQEGFNGTTAETEFANFISGEHAMMFNGFWMLGRLIQEMGGAENVGAFVMPYFPDREQYRYNDITYPSQILMSGRLSEAEEQATVEFVRFLTGPEVASWLANDANTNPARTDFELDEDAVDPLWSEVKGFMDDFELTGHDTFAYDPLPAVEFYQKDQIAGMLGGQLTPEDAAQNVAEFIEAEE